MQKLSDYSKLLETILKYNQSFGKHNIDAMVGYSWQYFYSEGQTTKAYGFYLIILSGIVWQLHRQLNLLAVMLKVIP